MGRRVRVQRGRAVNDIQRYAQLSQITLPNNSQVTYQNYQWMVPTSIQSPGAVKTLTLDALQRPISIAVKNSTSQQLLASRNYQYDKAGNITQINSDLGETQYGYDGLDRLTQAAPDQNLQSLGLPVEQYGYDPVHNRTSSAHQPGPWSYNADNQLTQYPKVQPFEAGAPAIQTQVTYTLQGHTKTESNSQGEKRYGYNAAERLTAFTSTPAGQATVQIEANYRYDPFGRRISKSVKEGGTAKATYFLYSDTGLMGEANEQGQLTKAYAFNPVKAQQGLWSTDPVWQAEASGGSLTAQSSSFHYLHTDHLGTPILATDKLGTTAWTAVAEAFGATGVLQGSSIAMNLRFPGQYWDGETGNHYNFRRDYGAIIGRYLESDPRGFLGGLNLFAYVLNSPRTFIDPEGGVPIPTSRTQKGRPAGYGCGDKTTDGLIPDAYIGFNFSIPCRKHDICYATCGNAKETCDSDFLNDMLWVCLKPRFELLFGIINPSTIGDCLFAASAYHAAVVLFGRPPYCAAQKENCPDCRIIPGCE